MLATALAKMVPGLEGQLEHMRAFLTLVYVPSILRLFISLVSLSLRALVMNGRYDCGFSSLSFEEFAQQDVTEHVQAVVAVLPEVGFASHCHRRVLPLLGRPPNFDPLIRAVVSLSSDSLARACDVVRDSVSNAQGLITQADLVVELGLQCIYGCHQPSQLIHMEELARMLQRLHAKISANDALQVHRPLREKRKKERRKKNTQQKKKHPEHFSSREDMVGNEVGILLHCSARIFFFFCNFFFPPPLFRSD